MRNLLTNLPASLPEEVSEVLAANGSTRIERIVSTGHRSPDGFWYDQAEHEWVMVLQGEAKLLIENQDILHLKAGCCLNIEAHQRHRVEWTTPNMPTVWLAIFYSANQ